ncbi:MAG: hypothetical protein AB7E27_04655 [Candidatus Methanomethylophilaceae archaeon]|jgi:riboflavin synthase
MKVDLKVNDETVEVTMVFEDHMDIINLPQSRVNQHINNLHKVLRNNGASKLEAMVAAGLYYRTMQEAVKGEAV